MIAIELAMPRPFDGLAFAPSLKLGLFPTALLQNQPQRALHAKTQGLGVQPQDFLSGLGAEQDCRVVADELQYVVPSGATTSLSSNNSRPMTS